MRVSIEAECTLEDFWCVINNVNNTRRYDPDVDKLELLQSPPYGSVLYTSYRGIAGLVDPRDFCTITASKFLTEREGSDAQLYTEGIHSAALVVSSVDCDDYPPQPGVVRGTVYAHGFIAIATPPGARHIRIFYIALVDPKGGDAFSAKLEDAAAMRLATKATAIAKLSEANGRGELRKSAVLGSPSVARGEFSEMPDADEDAYLKELLRNQSSLKWGAPISVGAATIETATITVDPSAEAPSSPSAGGKTPPPQQQRKLAVIRATMEVQCSLASFENAITNADNRRKFEPEIDVLQYHDSPANATISTCCYKRDKALSMAGCAVNEITVSRLLRQDEIDEHRLVTSGMRAAVYAVNTVDYKVPQTSAEDLRAAFVEEGFAKATVHAHGYIATAIPPDAPRIRVTHHWCVCADGDEEAGSEGRVRRAQHEAANRMVRLAALCQSTEAVRTEAFFSTNEEIANGSFFSGRGRTLSAGPSGSSASFTSPIRGGLGNGSITSPDGAGGTRSRAVSSAPSSAEIRVNRLYSRLMGLVDREDWKKGSVVEGCLIETCNVNYTSFNAVRISTVFNCSLETLRDFLKEEENIRKYDATLDTFEVLQKTADSAVLYCNYKRQSRLVSPRDFVIESTHQMLTSEEAYTLRLTKRPDNLGAFVQSSVSVRGHKEPVKDWVRGTIHAFGYVAIAEGPNRLQVSNYACVDPSGSIPKWISDATTSLSAKTLATIRIFCEEMEKKK